MSNIRVTVEPQASAVVKIREQSPVVSVAEDRVGPVSIEDPSLVVSIIEGFMTIFRLGDAVDVDLTDVEDGSVLVYKASTEKWTSTRLLEQQYVNSGQF